MGKMFLYDLDLDIAETTDISDEFPDIVEEFAAAMME